MRACRTGALLLLTGCLTATHSRLSAVESPVPLVPHVRRSERLIAVLHRSPGNDTAATVEVTVRRDSALEYRVRLTRSRGEEETWTAGVLVHHGPAGSEEQVATFFVEGALTAASPEMRGTMTVVRMIPVPWLADELLGNPERFSAVFSDRSGGVLRGRFQ